MHRVEDYDAWDELVHRSPQGTLFSERSYLGWTGRKYHLWWVKQGTELKAGVCLVVSDDERRCELDDFVIYGGILFDLNPKRQMVKLRHDEFQITEFVAEHLTHHYEAIELALSPQFMDMRPFLWHRYHDAEIHKYALELRYTSYLELANLREFAGNEEGSIFFAEMETVRRYSVREAARKGGMVILGNDSHILLTYYQNLMARQGNPQPVEKLAAMRRVIDGLLLTKRGVIFHVLDVSGNIVYAIMYGWDNKRAYYLFAAGHPETSTPWQGTLAHWEAFKYLAQRCEINEVDLEGVNSPQRGWFKLGFGGDLRAYCQVSKGIPSSTNNQPRRDSTQ